MHLSQLRPWASLHPKAVRALACGRVGERYLVRICEHVASEALLLTLTMPVHLPAAFRQRGFLVLASVAMLCGLSFDCEHAFVSRTLYWFLLVGSF